jgi:hypothetical protein
MASNDYHFITHWRVKGTLAEVNDILGDAADLVRWWPSVYLEVEVLEPGDENYIGRIISLYTKGWLPYTLRWQFEVVESNYPYGSRIEARGDFNGRGIWTFEQDGEWVNITYDWKITAEKGLLRTFSILLKPIFGLNHEWAMAKGLQSLKLEMVRRNAVNDIALALIPPPPGPTTSSPAPILLGTAALVLFGAWLVSKRLKGEEPDL